MLFAVIGASYATALPAVDSDSRLSTLVSLSIIHDHNLDLDEYSAAVVNTQPYLSYRSHGHIYSVYPYGASLLAVPLIALADLRAGLTGQTLDSQARRGVIPSGVEYRAASCIAFLAVLVMALTLRRMGAPQPIALLLTAGWALGGPLASTAARGLWQHGPASLVLGLASLGVVEVSRRQSGGRSVRGPLLLVGIAAAYAPLIRATLGISGLLFIATAALLTVRARQIRSIGWLVSGAMLVIVPAAVVLRSLDTSGYQSPAGIGALRLSSIPSGLAGLLVSPSRGLFIWCPFIVIVGIVTIGRWRPIKSDLLIPACLGLGALTVLGFTAAWPTWWGGFCVGPRMMAEFATLLVLFFGSISRGMSIGRPALCAIGLTVVMGAGLHWIGAHRTVMDTWNVSPNIDENTGRLWSWSDSQLLIIFRRQPVPAPP